MTLRMTSNLPADYATNTWSCVADNDTAAQAFVTELIEFYRDVQGSLANVVALDDHIYKIFNRADPIPRQPVAEGTWDLTTTPSASALPQEVALCLSFQGDPESGVSQARKRGRVYIGPLGQNTIASTGRPSSTFVTTLATAGDTLLTSSVASGTWDWTVHSATTGDNSVVTNGWVDDEYDTQRRRGRIATSRTVFS